MPQRPARAAHRAADRNHCCGMNHRVAAGCVGTQVMVADKSAPGLLFGSCGTSEDFGLVHPAAVAGLKPHEPVASANRTDNKVRASLRERTRSSV